MVGKVDGLDGMRMDKRKKKELTRMVSGMGTGLITQRLVMVNTV